MITFSKKSFLFSVLLSLSLFSSQEVFCENSIDYQAQAEQSEDFGKQQFLQSLAEFSSEFDQDTHLIDKGVWNELRMDDIVDLVNGYATTIIAKQGLTKVLMPLNNKQDVLNRQTIQKQLIEDESKSFELHSILREIALALPEYARYYNPENKLHIDVDGLYYKRMLGSSYLNGSKVPLDALVAQPALDFVGALCLTRANIASVAMGASAVAFNSNKTRYDKLKSICSMVKDNVISNIKFPFTLNFDWRASNEVSYQKVLVPARGGFVETIAPKQGGNACSGYGVYSSIKNVLKIAYPSTSVLSKKSALIAGSVTALGIGLYDGYLGYVLNKIYGATKDTFGIAQELQNSLVNVSKLFKSLNKLESFVADNVNAPVVVHSSLVSLAYQLRTIKQGDTPLAELFELMKEDTFDSPSAVFYSRGNVLRAHALMKEAKDELLPLLQGIAELDALCAVASWYKDLQSSSATVSFVNFVDNDTPVLHLKNAWTPLLSPSEVELNDVALGGVDHGNNIVLTGPNGGGKSTIMFTMAHAVVLGQSCGFAPASEATMTAFGSVATALDPKADIGKGLSSLMAEKQAFDRILADIKQSQPGHFIFALLDEPLRGTVDKEAEKRVYNLGQDVAQYNNACLVMATHLEKPVELATDTDGAFANYQMGHAENLESGHFIRTYKLENGHACWWFEDGDKRSRFIDWLCMSEVSK